MLLGERGPRDGEDAGPPAGWEQGLDRRDLHERRGCDRCPAGARERRLMECEEAATRGEAVRAEVHQFLPRLHESIQKPGCPPPHDPIRGRFAHHPIEHREGPGSRVADIARDAREPRFEHQDPDARPVDRLPPLPHRAHDPRSSADFPAAAAVFRLAERTPAQYPARPPESKQFAGVRGRNTCPAFLYRRFGRDRPHRTGSALAGVLRDRIFGEASPVDRHRVPMDYRPLTITRALVSLAWFRYCDPPSTAWSRALV